MASLKIRKVDFDKSRETGLVVTRDFRRSLESLITTDGLRRFMADLDAMRRAAQNRKRSFGIRGRFRALWVEYRFIIRSSQSRRPDIEGRSDYFRRLAEDIAGRKLSAGDQITIRAFPKFSIAVRPRLASFGLLRDNFGELADDLFNKFGAGADIKLTQARLFIVKGQTARDRRRRKRNRVKRPKTKVTVKRGRRAGRRKRERKKKARRSR